ncbi:MAG: Twin-arginine translocation pathway signal sequence domain-containing protein, partial [Betaproteobacteria bacterium]
MNRRDFLRTAGMGTITASLPLFGQTNGVAWAQSPSAASVKAPAPLPNSPYSNLLVLIELKGANDGLNTVVPLNDPLYQQLRPRVGLDRTTLLNLTETEALHPSLKPLLPMWESKELAVIQG